MPETNYDYINDYDLDNGVYDPYDRDNDVEDYSVDEFNEYEY